MSATNLATGIWTSGETSLNKTLVGTLEEFLSENPIDVETFFHHKKLVSYMM